MSFNGGYQSTINLNDLTYVGDFPLQHLEGAYGIAMGTGYYNLSLNPSIDFYRPGMLIEVLFNHSNVADSTTININNKGERPLKKAGAEGLLDLQPNELSLNKIYLLVFDGQYFQLINTTAVQATETIAGYAAIASQAEVNTGTDNTKFVTPLKLLTLLNAKIKPMRIQVRFFSLSQAELSIAPSRTTDALVAPILVAGLPAAISIRQASLSWEGTFRNEDPAGTNGFSTGSLALQKDAGVFALGLPLAGKVLLAPGQISFFRLVEADFRAVVTGNGTYTAKFSIPKAITPNIRLAGFWTLEIDYEPL